MSYVLHLRPEYLGEAAANIPNPRGETAGGSRFLLSGPTAGLSLSPGEYEIIVETRGPRPKEVFLILRAAETTRAETLQSRTKSSWGAVIPVDFAPDEVILEVRGGASSEFQLRSIVLAEGRVPKLPWPAKLVGIARPIYRLAPRDLRRNTALLLMRLKAFRKFRAAAFETPRHPRAGRIRTLDDDTAAIHELAARRSDFDLRFAEARSLGRRSEASMQPVPEVRSRRSTQAIAFYLPQFHRIAENDAWWEPGFTEWTNVTKAVPQFVGHHQPRLPAELGFYDLTNSDAIARQVELACRYGVSAFCFYYYWFGGKRLLERPLDLFATDKSLDIKFALCWANETWSRRWDGSENSVLIAQRHSKQDHEAVFDDMARYLEDERALRVGGRPMLIVYRPDIIPDTHVMLDIWRERAVRRGWPGIYIAATNAFYFEAGPGSGFDGLVEFPPHGIQPRTLNTEVKWLNDHHTGTVFDYVETVDEAVARLQRATPRNIDRFPGVMPGWDNEARRPGAGNIFHNSTPQAYARWLEAACDCAERTLPADRRFVFINAWNEWAEGAYLEPDRKWGRAYLEVTSRVLGVVPSACAAPVPGETA